MTTTRYPYFHRPGRHDTWEVTDGVRLEIDCVPTEQAAENIACSLNRAYERGRVVAQKEMRQALGVKSNGC